MTGTGPEMKREGTYRFYRVQHQKKSGWVGFQVKYRETDLWIRAREDLRKEGLEAVLNCRHQLETYIARFPQFLGALTPLREDPLAPALVRRMLEASRHVGVGPMAAVAGAIAEAVAVALKPLSPSIIVENGGDCYMDLEEESRVGIYAGQDSPFTGRIALRFPSHRFPFGICTSSGTIGHSLSFGKADAVTVVARDAALADAAATAVGNRVQSSGDISEALEQAGLLPGLEGVLIIVGDKMGVWGNLDLVPL